MERDYNIFNSILTEAASAENNLDNCLPLLFRSYEMNYTKLINKTTCLKYYPNLFIPDLIIIDGRKFKETFNEFIDASISFYKDDENYIKSTNPTKYLLYKTLENALLNEFDDIRNLFLRYINFYKNARLNDYIKPKKVGYSDLLCGDITLGISKESIESTTPYSFHISIERIINNDLFYYDFPCLKYGISKDKAYIFGISKVNSRKKTNNDKVYLKELSEYQSTIESLLQKSIGTKEINCYEVFVLIAFISLLYRRGIKEIIVPTILINKYNGFEISCYKILSKLNESLVDFSSRKNEADIKTIEKKIKLVKQELDNHANEVEEKNINLIKNFKFLEEICPDYKIYDYPMQKDTNLHFFIIDETHKCSNKLLSELINIINKHEDTNNVIKSAK